MNVYRPAAGIFLCYITQLLVHAMHVNAPQATCLATYIFQLAEKSVTQAVSLNNQSTCGAAAHLLSRLL